MSSAGRIPETRGLTGDDARRTLHRVGIGKLFADAYLRLRLSDGFSHIRSLSFVISLIMIQGLVALVGLAQALNQGRISLAITAVVEKAVPGPAGQVLVDSIHNAQSNVAEHRYSPLVIGLLGCLVTGATAFGQIERGLNRLYGVEQDRPVAQKYGFAALYAVLAGSLAATAFSLIAFGNDLFTPPTGGQAAIGWMIARWPLGLGLATAAVTVILRLSPRRVQPHFTWLALGTAIAVTLWGISTAGLWAFFHYTSFGTTYGPIAGVLVMMFWAFFSSFSLLYGAAVAAQLEAVRAGVSKPQDPAMLSKASQERGVRKASSTPKTTKRSAAKPRPAAKKKVATR